MQTNPIASPSPIEKVTFTDGNLIIQYPGYGTEGRGYGELFDMLGDHDVITASEIGQDVVLMSGTVFRFTDADESTLEETGSVTLASECSLDEWLDLDEPAHVDFKSWYQGQG